MATTLPTRLEVAPLSLEKVLQLFEQPHSRDLHARHAAAVERICRQCAGGTRIDFAVDSIQEYPFRALFC